MITTLVQRINNTITSWDKSEFNAEGTIPYHDVDKLVAEIRENDEKAQEVKCILIVNFNSLP